MLKPDAVTRGLCGRILSRFETRGFKIVAAKMMRFDQGKCEEHYAHLKDKPFFPRLVEFICQTPVLTMVLEGKDAVNQVREMCGPTDCGKAPAGTIRGDFGLSIQSNVIHASDSLETAKQEIARFFKPEELMDYVTLSEPIVYGEDERK